MSKTYTVKTATQTRTRTITREVQVNIITISRKQLWLNFAEAWTQMCWDHGDEDIITLNKTFATVSKALCSGDLIQRAEDIVQLFRDCFTVFLMGDAMEHMDPIDVHSVDVECDIVVTDDDGNCITIKHGDINY